MILINIIRRYREMRLGVQCARNMRIERSPPVVWSVHVCAWHLYAADRYRRSKHAVRGVDMPKVCGLLVFNGAPIYIPTYVHIMHRMDLLPQTIVFPADKWEKGLWRKRDAARRHVVERTRDRGFKMLCRRRRRRRRRRRPFTGRYYNRLPTRSVSRSI